MNVDNILKALSQIVGELHLLTGSAMDGFLTDHRRRYHGKALAVVRPGSVDELCQVVRFCHEHRIPMVPQGGNTGLCGGATPSLKGDALVIALARLNRIRAVDKANLTITVEAGCTLAEIRQAAESVDRLFA